MELQILRTVADLGLGAFVVVILMLWKRQDDMHREKDNARFQTFMEHFLKRQEELLQMLARVIEANNRALSDVNTALREVRDFMDRVDRRLAKLEEKLEEVGRGGKTTFR
jgi:septal ring factor EnvC (AmiA/AmiB activator)